MRLLAWDTSSKAGALAAIEWEPQSQPQLRAELCLNVDTNQSEQLLWGVDSVLQATRWQLQDLDYLAVGVGPGSFTGLRIGVTTARTLAHTLKKPLIAVSSLAALARPAAQWLVPQKKAMLIVSTDACKGELFALWGNPRTCLDCAGPGLWKRGVEEKVLSPEELMRQVKRKLGSGKDARWLAIGEGRKRYKDAWKMLPAKQELESVSFSDQVQGRYVATLAWEAIQAGLARDALDVHPRYLRASDAELKLKAGLLPPGPSRGE